METVKKEDVEKYLTARIATLEGFIQGHRKKISEGKGGDEIRPHLESIGKLQSRKSECSTIIAVINSMK